MKKVYSLLLLTMLMVQSAFAVDVTVTMNNTSKTMSLVNKATNAAVEVGTPTSNKYSFAADAGTYVLTAYGSDGTTVNGTIELNITEADKDFTVLTCTAYASNTGWAEGTDYTFAVDVNTREGVKQVITVGNSTTAGRKTFLALNGNSYYASFIPNEAHQAEGYMTLYKGGTLTAGVNVYGAIPMGADYTITLPADADLYLGIKFAHFLKFQEIVPTSTTTEGGVKKLTYRLADAQAYNYRTWKTGGLTQAGYFYMNADATKCPQLAFTDADYEAFGQKTIKHDVQWNGGYETGDIFVNVNERGHLKMNVGDTYDAHAMRTWELTDNSTNNYFIEPDFHYTVINPDGTPSTGVIEIENPNTTTDPWSTIKAVGKGTAIVLVTYDAIGLNYYGSGKTTKTAYMGGEYWSAIWPENTAAYVVSVGDAANSINPNMLINETYNLDTKKNAGKNVDAEHDVFYYLDTEAGYTYTFKPEGVSDVQVAYPTIGAQSATYNGFSSTGVTKNEDGSYSLLLKEGRQIVKLTDASGNAVYQVLTAKSCHREITNETRPGSAYCIPGDKVKIQYSGLRHPANKMAGIYNMSGYVTYNGVPNGTSLILGSGQYTFGSAASAQAVTVEIPLDQKTDMVMNDGVIQVNGYGDPIGNHRLISRVAGRSANFTAIAHKTYFGALPEIQLPVKVITKEATINVTPETATLVVKDPKGNAVTPNEEGKYILGVGTYSYVATATGYEVLRGSFTTTVESEEKPVIDLALVALSEKAWDGAATSEPKKVDDIYQISTGAELAWFAANVNGGDATAKAVLTDDINLGGFNWTPIGNSSKQFKGTFDGQGHSVKGLYTNGTTYQGLFGYINAATVSGVSIYGEVNGTQYVGGLVGNANGACVIDRVANYANVNATTASGYVAGIVGRVYTATTKITNCLNQGTITGTNYVAGILNYYLTAANVTVTNVYNTGEIIGTQTGAIRALTSSATTTGVNITNAFAVKAYFNDTKTTIVTEEQMKSGEIAFKLGEAFGQAIGKDAAPVLGGMKVYEVEGAYTNNNPAYADLVNFEDVTLAEGATYYNGSDEAGLIATATDYSFMNYYTKSSWGESWCGFAVSATTGKDFSGSYNDETQFNSCLGGGMESRQFAVGYYSEYNALMEEQYPDIYATKNFKPEYAYITNTANALKSMLNGDAIAKKFTKEDYLLLKITGLDKDDDETGHVDFYLAKDSVFVTNWTKVDLTPLGTVDHVRFTMASSDVSYGFMNTPAYFCLDNMKAALTDDVPTAISTVKDAGNKAAAVEAIFSADGKRLSAPQRGMNIIRMSDGTTRKLMIK